jgi:DNA-binding Lrp family transcriptional regulator
MFVESQNSMQRAVMARRVATSGAWVSRSLTSSTPCRRREAAHIADDLVFVRVRRLRAAGIIERTVALLAPAALGYPA